MSKILAKSHIQQQIARQKLARSRQLAYLSRIALQDHCRNKQQFYLEQHLKRSRQRELDAKIKLRQAQRQNRINESGNIKNNPSIAAITASSMTRSKNVANLAAQRIQLARARTIHAQNAIHQLSKTQNMLMKNLDIRKSKERLDLANNLSSLKLKQQKLAQQAAQARLRSQALKMGLPNKRRIELRQQIQGVQNLLAAKRENEQQRIKRAMKQTLQHEQKLAKLKLYRKY